MIKNIMAALALLIPLQIYAQHYKVEGFTQKVFSSSFTDEDKSIWPLKNNQYYFFLVKDGKYILESRNDSKKAYLVPKGVPSPENFQLEARLTVQRGSSDIGSVGIAFNIQEGLSDGYLVEMNSVKQFRVSRIKGSGDYEYLTGEADRGGWLEFPGISKTGVPTLFDIVVNNGSVDIYINSKNAFAFKSEAPQGQSGLFINSLINAEAQDFSLYGPAAPTPPLVTRTIDDNKLPGVTKEPLTENSGTTADADIATLTVGLLECRKENKELSTKNENYRDELSQCRKKQDELQQFIQENLDVKLQAQISDQQKRIQEVSAQNEVLIRENKELSEFKQAVQGNKDGDLVIVLSENLKKEQEKNTQLQEQVRKLQEELKRLKGR